MSRIHKLAERGDASGVRGLLQTNAALVNEKGGWVSNRFGKVVAPVHI